MMNSPIIPEPPRVARMPAQKRRRPITAIATKSQVGLRILSPPSYEEPFSQYEPPVDIVAVHGIGADPDRTWTTTNDVNWLMDKDMLPKVVSNARIMRFAYESRWIGKESVWKRLSLIAGQLLRSLLSERENCHERPIIFIGHCFGGLVVEKAILDARLFMHRYSCISDFITGVIFLGTPHRESMLWSAEQLVSTFASVLGCGNINRISKVVENDPKELRNLLSDFRFTMNTKPIPLYCFFEKQTTDLTVVSRNKHWKFLQLQDIVVDERSGSIDGFRKYGLACDHFHINKFPNPKDGNYLCVTKKIRKLAKDSHHCLIARTYPERLINDSSYIIDKSDRACLQALFMNHPVDDLNDMRMKEEQLLVDAGVWIVRDQHYTKWLNDDQSQVLWLTGSPGRGKTMLAIILIEYMKMRIEFEGTPRNRSCLAYFFCDSRDNRKNDAVSILRGLLYQIVCQRPQLFKHLRKEYNKYYLQLFSSPNSMQVLWDILRQMLANKSIRTVYLVVDALDECEGESLKKFLVLLGSCMGEMSKGKSRKQSCAIKWLFTSRCETLIANDTVIGLHLGGLSTIKLEANLDEVEPTVIRFVEAKVKALVQGRYSLEVQERLEDALRQKAETSYLWVALACRELEELPSIAVRLATERLPPGLYSIYDEVLKKLKDNTYEVLAAHAIQILHAVAVAFRPLSLQELAIAAGLPVEDHDDDNKLKEYVALCGTFLTVRRGAVHFIHQSAKDYLLSSCNTNISLNLSSNLETEHKVVAGRCFKDVCDQWATNGCDPDATSTPYSILHWMEHVRMASADVALIFDLEAEFFKPQSQMRRAFLRTYGQFMRESILPYDLPPLHLAAYSGMFHLAKKLLESDPGCIDDLDSLKRSPLHWAAIAGREEIVELLLSHNADADLRGYCGRTAVHEAAIMGQTSVVRVLMANGADIHEVDKLGSTAFHDAAGKGYDAIAELLLREWSVIDPVDEKGQTPLYRAVENGNVMTSHFLLDHQANVHAKDIQGRTLLHIAAGRGHEAITKLLLDRGAQLEARCSLGWTVLHEASVKGHDDVVHLLLDSGADIEARGAYKWTALHRAAEIGAKATVQLLLKRGADINAKGEADRTALHWAARKKHIEIIDILLEGGANADAQSFDGRTPLHDAADRCSNTAVMLLTTCGANRFVKDRNQRLAHELATDRGRDDIATLIRDFDPRFG